jgi:hypothetical protein
MKSRLPGEKDQLQVPPGEMYPDLLAPYPVEGGKLSVSQEKIDGGEGRPLPRIVGEMPE